MAKAFTSIKNGLGLLDILQIGKYKGCRVDSIIEMDDAYLRYMQHEKILRFDASVLEKLTSKFLDGVDVEYDEESELEKTDHFMANHGYATFEDYFDDIPF